MRGSNSLVEQPVFFDSTDGPQPFDVQKWETHRSTSRYALLIPGILVGATTKRITAVIGGLVLFSALVGGYNDLAAGGEETLLGFLPMVQIPLTPFELTAPVLGLLLVSTLSGKSLARGIFSVALGAAIGLVGGDVGKVNRVIGDIVGGGI